jgi:hypothetical protein
MFIKLHNYDDIIAFSVEYNTVLSFALIIYNGVTLNGYSNRFNEY